MFGHVMPFDSSKLKAIYGDLENYEKQAAQSADRDVAGGFILKEDRDELIRRVVETAKRRGL